MAHQPNPVDIETSDKPPLFKTWKHWYGIVLGVLVLEIILLSLLTYAYA